VTSGIMDATCNMLISGTTICHATGTQAATYTNPTSPSTFGRFALATATLRATDTTFACLTGHDDVVDMTPQTFTVSTGTGGPTPHLGPIVTRTA
jgi:hypothetical protein